MNFKVIDSCNSCYQLIAVRWWVFERRVRELFLAGVLGAARVAAVRAAAATPQLFSFWELTEIAGWNLNALLELEFGEKRKPLCKVPPQWRPQDILRPARPGRTRPRSRSCACARAFHHCRTSCHSRTMSTIPSSRSLVGRRNRQGRFGLRVPGTRESLPVLGRRFRRTRARAFARPFCTRTRTSCTSRCTLRKIFKLKNHKSI